MSAGGPAAEIFAEVDAAGVSKGGNRFASGGVQGVDEVHHANEDALVLAIRPIGETAIGLCAANSGVELPQQFASRRIQSEYFLRRRDSVEHAVNDDGAGLKAAFLVSVKTPGDGEALDVAAIDLRETGIVIVLARATVGRPILLPLGRCGESSRCDGCANKQS